MIPARVDTVAAVTRERPILLIEAESVDLVALGRFGGLVLLAVALEAEALFVVEAGYLDVVPLDAAAALDRSDAESLTVRKAHQRAGRKLQRRVNQITRVKFVLLESLFQVPHMDESVLMSSHEQGPRAGGIVHGHSDVDIRLALELLGTLPGPELDLCVPATRNNDTAIVVWQQNTEHVFHRGIVLAHLHHLVRAEAPAFYRVIGAGQQNGWLVDLPIHAQDRTLDILLELGLNLTRFLSGHHLQIGSPDRNLAVPRRHSEQLSILRVRLYWGTEPHHTDRVSRLQLHLLIEFVRRAWPCLLLIVELCADLASSHIVEPGASSQATRCLLESGAAAADRSRLPLKVALREKRTLILLEGHLFGCV